MSKRFVWKNESFTCRVCQTKVPPHPKSCRDHCQKCLTSLHVDVYPGDRQNSCQGLLKPIGVSRKKGALQIVYRCEKCQKESCNLAAPDDNQSLIIQLSANLFRVQR